jgi:hypothetical protein
MYYISYHLNLVVMRGSVAHCSRRQVNTSWHAREGRSPKINTQQGGEFSIAAVKVAPPGDGHPEIKVPDYPGSGVFKELVNHV